MKYNRDNSKYHKLQEEHIKILINEAVTGITKKDTLKGRGRCITCIEAEIDYFNAIRDFFETNLSQRIAKNNQDIPETKILKMINDNT